jgi:hypothetical protein
MVALRRLGYPLDGGDGAGMNPGCKFFHAAVSNSDLAVGGDENGFHLKKWKVNKKTGKGYWSKFAYYGNIEQGVNRARFELLVASGAENLDELEAASKDAMKRLTQALAPQFKVVV